MSASKSIYKVKALKEAAKRILKVVGAGDASENAQQLKTLLASWRLECQTSASHHWIQSKSLRLHRLPKWQWN